MSFLKRLFGSGPTNGLIKISALDAATMDFKGRRRQLEVAGEFYRQDALNAVVGRVRADANVNITKVAALVPDPKNKFDPNAVEVRIETRLVGYLDRDQAANYHAAMAELGYPGRALANIEARIFGHRLDRQNHGGYGVALYLPEGFAKQIGFGKR